MWKTIDSAPENKLILGWMPGGDPVDVAGFAIVHRDGDGWRVVHDYEDWWWAGYKPTHWMPLPDPPDSGT